MAVALRVIDVICRLFERENGGSPYGPGEWIDGSLEFAGRFGTAPATTQAQLPVEEASLRMLDERCCVEEVHATGGA